MEPTRVALMGAGNIGRELLRRTAYSERVKYVAVGDSTGFLAKKAGFTEAELTAILTHKTRGEPLAGYDKRLYAGKDVPRILKEYAASVLVETTAAQSHATLLEALDTSSVVTSNKLPFADVSYADYRRLVDKAEREGRILDYGTTAGAGLRMPELARSLGADGVDGFSGCLSGTMNYVSQRLNEGARLSAAVYEAMNPPRNYAEPDPRIDIAGEDFRRKMVILSRLFGKKIGSADIKVEPLITDEHRRLTKEEFLERLPELDGAVAARVASARSRNRAVWFLGNADLTADEYSLGFSEIPAGDPMAQSRESDNVLRIQPRLWRRPVTLIGPGAGAAETVTGLIGGLTSAMGHR